MMWQPIETAPKPSSETAEPAPRIIVASISSDFMSVAYWDWYYAEGGGGHHAGLSAWIEPHSGESVSYHFEPTHWRPLLDLPKDTRRDFTVSAVEALMMQRARNAPPPKPWEKLPKVDGKVYCATCGGGRDKSGENFIVAVGFGSADVSASGRLIIAEDEWINGELGDTEVDLQLVEKVAQTRPELDWRIGMHGPLSGQEYQRQGDGEWVLVHRDEGFA